MHAHAYIHTCMHIGRYPSLLSTIFDQPKMTFDQPKTIFDQPKTIFDQPKTIFDQCSYICIYAFMRLWGGLFPRNQPTPCSTGITLPNPPRNARTTSDVKTAQVETTTEYRVVETRTPQLLLQGFWGGKIVLPYPSSGGGKRLGVWYGWGCSKLSILSQAHEYTMIHTRMHRCM